MESELLALIRQYIITRLTQLAIEQALAGTELSQADIATIEAVLLAELPGTPPAP